MFIADIFLEFVYLAIGNLRSLLYLPPQLLAKHFFPIYEREKVDLCSKVQLITWLNLASVKQARVPHENYS